jgi:hypothetical protein
MKDEIRYRMMLGPYEIHTDGAWPNAGEWLLNLRDIAGWRVRADDSTDTSDHWSGQGQVAGPPKTPGRQISIETELCGDLEAGLDAVSRLASATLVVAEEDRALARLADVRQIQLMETRITPTFSVVTLSLVADDPLRYSAESRHLSNGSLLLPNRGDQWAAPRLFLAGPHDAISIGHHTGTWTFPALASGQSRLIDCRERIVWNGTGRVFGASSGPWPRVQPGGATWVVSGLGAGKAILSRAEAWS